MVVSTRGAGGPGVVVTIRGTWGPHVLFSRKRAGALVQWSVLEGRGPWCSGHY